VCCELRQQHGERRAREVIGRRGEVAAGEGLSEPRGHGGEAAGKREGGAIIQLALRLQLLRLQLLSAVLRLTLCGCPLRQPLTAPVARGFCSAFAGASLRSAVRRSAD
jgi:hypothetical protein